MHRFVRITEVIWVHTSRIRAFHTDRNGFLMMVWLDGEQNSRTVTRRLQIIDQDIGDGVSTEWPFVAMPQGKDLHEAAPAEARTEVAP